MSSTTIPSTEEERKDYVKQHKVRVGNFWLAEMEVTWGQFRSFAINDVFENYGC